MENFSGNYVMYLRKSRADIEAEQRGDEETLSRHEHALLELAARLHIRVSGVYREIVSGETIAARPLMQKLLAEVEAGVWAGVLVMEIERLARGDTIDQGIVAQAFRLSGTRILTPSKLYDPENEFDEEYFEFGLFMSRREYKTINRRLQRGRAASVREGKYVGSVPPYGYRREKLEHEKGYILVPHPEQAPVVRLIFTLYTAGEQTPDGSMERLGVSRIARRLNHWNIPPQKGTLWSPSSVREILSNPVYAGKLRWNWRGESRRRENGRTVISRPRSPEHMLLIPGRHEPLVKPEIFSATQNYLSENRAPSIREKGAVRNPLAGLVLCGICGRRMQRRPYLKKNAPSTLLCPNAACSNASAELSIVETALLAALRPWLGSYRLSWETVPPERPSSAAFLEKAAAKLEKEIAALRQQRESLHDLLERGVYDVETFRTRSHSLSERIQNIRRKQDRLSTQLTDERRFTDSHSRFLPPTESLTDVYRVLSPGGKNRMLKELLDKVIYQKDPENRWSRPDAFTLDIFPNIPQNPPAE